MSWREFLLRREGYLRELKREAYNVRDVVYHSLVAGGALDHKKTKIDQFRPLANKEVKKADSSNVSMYLNEYKQYLEKVNNKK